jgi:hypothetical protein
VKGLVPSVRERPFISVQRLSRSREEACVCFYIVLRPVFFPKPMSPTPIRRRDGIRLRRSWLLRIIICFMSSLKIGDVAIDAVWEHNVT